MALFSRPLRYAMLAGIASEKDSLIYIGKTYHYLRESITNFSLIEIIRTSQLLINLSDSLETKLTCVEGLVSALGHYILNERQYCLGNLRSIAHAMVQLWWATDRCTPFLASKQVPVETTVRRLANVAFSITKLLKLDGSYDETRLEGELLKDFHAYILWKSIGLQLYSQWCLSITAMGQESIHKSFTKTDFTGRILSTISLFIATVIENCKNYGLLTEEGVEPFVRFVISDLCSSTKIGESPALDLSVLYLLCSAIILKHYLLEGDSTKCNETAKAAARAIATLWEIELTYDPELYELGCTRLFGLFCGALTCTEDLEGDGNGTALLTHANANRVLHVVQVQLV